MSKLICIDAGHGGKDSGAVNGSRYEKDDNLRFSIALEKALVSQGFRVIQTRKSDSNVSLTQRSEYADGQKADFFISCHRNAFVLSSANGIENWIYTKTGNETEKFATSIQNEVVKVGAQSNRGVKRGNYHVLRETNMPACLLELGFISNEKDNEMFDTLLEQYANAVAKGVCIYLNIPFKEDNPNGNDGNPQSPDKLYRVQVGAFAVKANADALAKELKGKGYSVIIV